MEVKVSFKNGVCEFKEPRLKAFDYSVEEGYGVIMLEGAWQRIIVETGLHSYEYDKRFAGFSYLFGCYLNAIIPAGSRFFAGTKGDIASDRLIIFETDEAYQKYISSQKRLSRRLMAKARVLIAKLKLKIRQI